MSQYILGSTYFLSSHMLYCSLLVSTKVEMSGSLSLTLSYLNSANTILLYPVTNGQEDYPSYFISPTFLVFIK